MREAAQVTGSTPEAMRVRLHRARARLNRALTTGSRAQQASAVPVRAPVPAIGEDMS
jgi:hypothetical protein